MSEEIDFDAMNRPVTEEFRANGGKVGGMFEGAPLLILHTTGAKTGTRHENPLMYRDEGGRRFVFASRGGTSRNPDWYYNIKNNPDVEVEVGTETLAATARIVDEPERTEIYGRQTADVPQFGDYVEAAHPRVIPVVEIITT